MLETWHAVIMTDTATAEERQSSPEPSRPELSSEKSETLRSRSTAKLDDEPVQPEQKPGILAKLGIDVPTLLMMFKSVSHHPLDILFVRY